MPGCLARHELNQAGPDEFDGDRGKKQTQQTGDYVNASPAY
jgi:hypothetical protein